MLLIHLHNNQLQHFIIQKNIGMLNLENYQVHMKNAELIVLHYI